jgi:hypothetical protein
MTTFTLTSGRSGTYYLKSLFALNAADCTAQHEPYLNWGNPTLFGKSIDDAQAGRIDRIRDLLARKKRHLERCRTRVYFEASHAFLKSAYVAAMEFFPELELIHLIRNPLAVAKSEANREHLLHRLHFPFRYYHADDGQRYFRWSLTGKEPIFQHFRHIQLSPYQRYLLQWIEIENRAMHFLDEHHKHERCFTLHSPADLNDLAKIQQLFDFFGLRLKHQEIILAGRKNRNPHCPTVLTSVDEREFEAVLANLPTKYLQIFTRHPYDSLRGSQLNQILKEL